MVYNEASKKATYKYRASNPEKTKEHSKADMRTYYLKNQEKMREQKKQYRLKKKNELLSLTIIVLEIDEKEEIPII